MFYILSEIIDEIIFDSYDSGTTRLMTYMMR